jgi:hypothetical protein
MCQASTALVASLLACTLPTEIFGTHTIPGHIYATWIHGHVYVPIETTMFNAETYRAVGVAYSYILPPSLPVSTRPYVYLDPNVDEAARVLYALDSRENDHLLADYSAVSSLFPFADGKDLVCKGIPLTQLYLLNDRTLRFEFPPTMTHVALQAFATQYIVGLIRRTPGVTGQYTYSLSKYGVDVIVDDPSTIFGIVEAMTPLTSQMNTPIVVRTGVIREPMIQDTKGIAVSSMRNMVVYFTQTPSSGTVTIDMKAYMEKKKKGRSWVLVKKRIASLKEDSITYTTDRDGDFDFTLKVDIDSESMLQSIDQLDTILLRETDGRSRATFRPKDPYGEILDDRVDQRELRPHNLIDGKHSISQLIAHQWYYGISVMGLSDISIRTNLDRFEETARGCDGCIQETIIGMRVIIQEHFAFLGLLSFRRPREQKRKERTSSKDDIR